MNDKQRESKSREMMELLLNEYVKMGIPRNKIGYLLLSTALQALNLLIFQGTTDEAPSEGQMERFLKEFDDALYCLRERKSNYVP